jgi:Flp pilus assembly protein TadB
MRIARPIYESLPWVYIVIGAAAIAISFMWRLAGWSDLMAGLGLIAMVSGLVLLLRRRDYRIQKRHYGAAFDDED